MTQLAATMSTMAYLQLALPPDTRAEKAADRRMVDAMVKRITSGQVTPRKKISTPDIQAVPMPTGAALREIRAAALANHARKAEVRRAAANAGAR